MKIRRIFLNLIPLFLLLCLGCATVPVTGRTQLMMISKAEEERIGTVALESFITPLIKKGKIIRPDDQRPHAQTYHRRIKTIGGKIVDAAGWRGEYDWAYVIVDEPKTINAGMYPAGKLVVYTGILDFARSDDELASVIGHEVAHAIARHGAERFSQITTLQFTAAALDVALGSTQYKEAIHVAFGLGTQFGVLLPYSRLHENESDYIGLLIMAKAGYDPQAAIQFWERMERDHSKTQIEFFSTHPSYGTRITNLKRWLPQALEYRANPSKPLPTKMRE